MSNPVKSADNIDWDKIAKRLGRAFEKAMDSVDNNEDYCDEDFRENLTAASRAADALTKIAAQVRTAKADTAAKNFSIEKPVK